MMFSHEPKIQTNHFFQKKLLDSIIGIKETCICSLAKPIQS